MLLLVTSIPENFCGYINIEEDRYVYNANGHIVKLFPVVESKKHDYASMFGMNIEEDDENDFRYVYGNDEGMHEIALLMKSSNIKHSMIGLSFFAPIIIKSCGNASGFYNSLSNDWNKYDAIMFSGGIIDSLYNPKIAALKMPSNEEVREQIKDFDGARSIEIKPFDEYTHVTNVLINERKIKMMFSVSQSGGEENINTTDLGSLKSFIQLQFDTPQDFITVHKYIRVIKKMLAVFSKQKNIDFDVSLKQRVSDEKYMETGICKVFVDNQDFYKPNSHRVIDIMKLLNNLPSLINNICNETVESLLMVLPDSNKNANQVSLTNVQDLCTALEVEYKLCKSKTSNDKLIDLLKKDIQQTIRDFVEKNPTIDVNRETTIHSSFQYLDYTSKQKILHLYNEHKESIDQIVEKWKLPDVNIESIGKFVALRNKKTHDGIVDWENSYKIYTPLLALVYACLLKRSEVIEIDIKETLSKLF